MNRERLRRLLEEVASGALKPEEALKRLTGLPYEDLGFARVDHHRALRKHFPEVIFGPGKSIAQLNRLVDNFLEKGLPLLITRLSPKKAEALSQAFPALRYHVSARLLAYHPGPLKAVGRILILTGGTADTPVMEEARVCAEYMGNKVEVIQDVGVAGLHRLFPELERLKLARVLIVIAGMEGALPSLVAGLVDKPIIAVPTSTGYGAHFSGLAPLLAMLNSCAPGVAVVNIDNGFGAAYMASLINQIPEEKDGTPS